VALPTLTRNFWLSGLEFRFISNYVRTNMERSEDILHYWFGNVEETTLPSKEREQIWFGGDEATDKEIKDKFYPDFMKSINGGFDDWCETPRGCLAVIIMLDQFSRHIYRGTGKAFEQDHRALQHCLAGIDQQHDHMLSLIERVFFYFPLMHSENAEMQSLSLRAYEMLVTLSFPEVRPVYEKFLDYAIKHNEIISRFGRFPYRNERLGRKSTPQEEEFLKNTGSVFE
jgi:uncharacterized protein (DUF924 family)